MLGKMRFTQVFISKVHIRLKMLSEIFEENEKINGIMRGKIGAREIWENYPSILPYY